MSKNINVEAHVKRYDQTELSDVVQLIDALQKLVESRKGEKVLKLKEQLAILERGEIPPPIPKPERSSRTTRGGKRKETTEEEV